MFRQLLNVSIPQLITVIKRIQFNLAFRHNGKKLNHSEITQVKRKQKAIFDLCLGFKTSLRKKMSLICMKMNSYLKCIFIKMVSRTKSRFDKRQKAIAVYKAKHKIIDFS